MRFNEQQRYYQKNRERILAKANKANRAKGIPARDDAKKERAQKVHGSILRLLAANGPMTVTRIAAQLGMSRTTAYNNLYAMTGVKCVDKKWTVSNGTEKRSKTPTVRSQGERQWYRRMKIWHALNNHGGLLIMEIVKLTGIAAAQVSDDLEEMGGVRSERVNGMSFRWYVQPD